MKIREAIEMLSGDTSDLTIYEVPEFLNAIKLGKEALKCYQKLKLTTFLPIGYKLPGEEPE